MPALIPIGVAVAGSVASATISTAITTGALISASALASAAASGLAMGVLSYAATAIFGADTKPKIDNSISDMVIQPITEHQIIYGRARVSGPLVFCDTVNPGNGKLDDLYMIVVLAGHECDAIEHHYFSDDEITLNEDGVATDDIYKDVAELEIHLGLADQAASQLMLDGWPGVWTSEFRLRGRTYVAFKLTADRDAYTGIPSYSAIVRGRKVYNPATGLWAWSKNPALCILDYLTQPFGLGVDINTGIDIASFIKAAEDCDEQVPTLSGTEHRYTCHGSFTLEKSPVTVLEELLTSCAGRLVCVQGKWQLLVGVPAETVSLTITPDMAVGPIKYKANRSRAQLINTVRGSFISPDHKWQQTDYPMVQSAAGYAADGGEYAATLDLPWTKSNTMAQRIAAIYLAENQAQAELEIETDLTGLRFAAGNTVYVTLPRFNRTAVRFMVNSWKLTERMSVEMVLAEHPASIYTAPTLKPLEILPDES